MIPALALVLSLFNTQVPQSSTGTQAWNLGVRIVTDVPGSIVAIRYFRLQGDLDRKSVV